MRKKFKDKILQIVYDWGYHAGYFGANSNNVHFSFFTTPEKTKAWTQGNDDGSFERERVIKKYEKKKK
jgi:hypothetical protein